MGTFLQASGVVAWLVIGFIFAILAFLNALGRGPVKRRLNQPSLAPYTWWATYRVKGFMMALMRRLGVSKGLPAEVIQAHREVQLASMKKLRDVYAEVDRLPTVEKGKAAVGAASVFEIAYKPVRRVPSPYTHPLQYPPYYIPGVPARMFYDPAEFEWARALEDAYPVIKDELLQVLASDGAGFKSYVSEGQQRLAGWNTYNFFFYGKKFEENCARCPRTTALLESLPRFERDHIMFSSLNPHSRIPPHVGPMNGIVRAHLPLIVPQGCYIRVGSEERTWHEGKLLAFDDSFEHEVFNHSDQVRIVLFMNFWHPCFQTEELPVLERFRNAYEASPLSRVHERNQVALRKHDIAAPKPAVAAA
jgi:aspartyl/asparaginyl beta-hydroxylase (cupin superfamily)